MRIGSTDVARVSAGIGAALPSGPAAEVMTPAPLFSNSTFQPAQPAASAASYYPTQVELNRPTDAYVVNVTTGDRQPLNPAQMSNQQGVDFVQARLAELGYAGPAHAANTTFPTSGPFQINYNGDDRQHWDIDGMNVGLTEQLYASYPKDVADRMLQAQLKYARPQANDDDAPVPQSPAFAPMRVRPGTDLNAAFQAATPIQSGPAGWPTQNDIMRPTPARVVGVDGSSQPLNPGQMSSMDQAQQVLAHLQQLGYRGPTDITNVAPSGMFNVDYGSDPRRNFNIGDLNVGLILQRYANSPPEVADAQMRAELKQQGLL